MHKVKLVQQNQGYNTCCTISDADLTTIAYFKVSNFAIKI